MASTTRDAFTLPNEQAEPALTDDTGLLQHAIFTVPRYELVEMADNAPAAADAVSRLYAALIEMRRRPAATTSI